MDPFKHPPNWFIESMPEAFAYHQIIKDSDSNPVDYRFIYVNQAFEMMTGLKKNMVIGKNVTEILPKIIESQFDWIKTYGRVSLAGENLSFEQYSEPLVHQIQSSRPSKKILKRLTMARCKDQMISHF